MYCKLIAHNFAVRRRIHGYREMAMTLIQSASDAQIVAPTGVTFFLQGNALVGASPGVYPRTVLTFTNSDRRVFSRVCEHYDDVPEIQRRMATYDAKRIAGMREH